jgi:tRNA pseudouridine38-40 synthase
MAERTVQLVLHYDGARFAGWQRQAAERTVQGELERSLARLLQAPTAALGAGRTDAGVHARGQAAGVRVPEKWTPTSLRRALNAVLPDDLWVAAAHEMEPAFHARYSATARRYSYAVGLSDAARSPFRRTWEWAIGRPFDRTLLDAETAVLPGTHCFGAFAVRGTAPPQDTLHCAITRAGWREEGDVLFFDVAANRFLHHMVRFLVGTLLDVATGRRPAGTVARLLEASDNREVSPPAPPHALCLEHVEYPRDLYLQGSA